MQAGAQPHEQVVPPRESSLNSRMQRASVLEARPALDAQAKPPPPDNVTPLQHPHFSVSQEQLERRMAESGIFVPACRRDVYRVLCLKRQSGFAEGQGVLNHPAGAPAAETTAAQMARTQPLQWLVERHTAKHPVRIRGSTPDDETVLHFVPVHGDAPTGFVRFSPEAYVATLQALAFIGTATEAGAALTAAFERLLVQEYVPWWSDADAATLSASFLLAFRRELTPRLDVSHAIRSRKLSAEEVEWLRQLGPSVGLNTALLDVFQGGPC